MYSEGYHSDGYTTIFESLPVAGLLQLEWERIEEIKSYTKQIVYYYRLKKECRVPSKTIDVMELGLKERYNIASDYITKMDNLAISVSPLNTRIFLKNEIEASLFALLVCDDECKYYKIYEAKKSEGLSHEEALDYLKMYFGIRSPKLIQLERYYQILNYRKEKSKTGIFDNPDDTPPKR